MQSTFSNKKSTSQNYTELSHAQENHLCSQRISLSFCLSSEKSVLKFVILAFLEAL